MKNLPGIKIIGFIALVLVVGFAVSAETKGKKEKHSKYLVKFGWSETVEDALDCSDRSVKDIQDHLTGLIGTAEEARKRYKIQQFNGENVAPDPEQGELDICFPGSTPKPTATSASPTAEASPSGTPKGAKTEAAGYVLFGNTKDAQAFADWVNSTPTPSPKPTQKRK